MTLEVKLLRAIPRVISAGITHDDHIDPRLSIEEKNYIKGGGLIMMLSWLQHNTSTNIWEQRYHRPFNWIHWDEFLNLCRIRNCFAHGGDGTIPDNLRNEMNSYLTNFLANPPVNVHGENVAKYYDIENNKIILIGDKALRRCASICYNFYQNMP